jgi:hypothetical protein
MNKLTALRDRLAALRRRRQTGRWASAWSAPVLAILWCGVAAFLVDWTLQMSVPQRAAWLVVWALAAGWSFYQFALPLLGQRESELDMALLVEQKQHIDSDLVAALQFDSPSATAWGSPQLETAVIDYVAEFGQGLDIFAGFNDTILRRRFIALAATIALLGLGVALFPAHAGVFMNRFMLGSQHYPSRTSIESLVISGQRIDLHASADAPPPKVPYGEPLKFQVRGEGELPEAGYVQLSTVIGHVQARVELKPASLTDPGLYEGELERLVDDVWYQIYLGDAWTEPARLAAIPLPVVSVSLKPTPPAYASHLDLSGERQREDRQVAVIEGSQVDVTLKAINKDLKDVTLKIGMQSFPLAKEDSAGRTWRLAPEGTPMAAVSETLSYEIQVTDQDGLHLPEPIKGAIRLKSDRGPRVTGVLVTQHVLPTAKPLVTYGAADDFGVARLKMHRQVVRQDGTTQDDAVEIPLGAEREKVIQGRWPLDLAPMKLLKGDQVKLTLEAIDFRGTSPGKSALSEPLVLQVTDERGVLAAMAETDERSARQLDAIIQRQLGIGESP